MSDSLATIIVAIIMSIPGSIALFKQWKTDKAEAKKLHSESEKQEAEATEKIQAAALKMMEVYKQEFENLKSRIRDLECRVKDLETALQAEMEDKKIVIEGAWKLHDQVKELNGVPYYVPPNKLAK